MNKQQEKGFAKGVAYCIQLIEKEFGFGEFIFSEAGMSVKDYEDAGVDQYDLNAVKRIDALVSTPEKQGEKNEE